MFNAAHCQSHKEPVAMVLPDWAETKSPRQSPAGGSLLSDQQADPTRSSRNDVAMDAHAVHPDVLVVEHPQAARLSRVSDLLVVHRRALRHRVQMAIVAFQTDVEVLGDVPLGARRHAPVAPVKRASAASRAERAAGDRTGAW